MLEGLKALGRFMKPNASLRQVHVFIFVAHLGPVTLKEICRRIGAPSGTIYDDLQDLGKTSTSGRTGAGLVTEVAPAVSGSAHQFILTGRGEYAVEALGFAMEAAMLPDDPVELAAYFERKRAKRA
jgi:hypothetical protein